MIGSTLGLVGVGVFGLFRLGRAPVVGVGDEGPPGFDGAAEVGRTAQRVTTTTSTTTTTTLPPPEGLLSFPVDGSALDGIVVADNFGGLSVASGLCNHAGIDIFSPTAEGGEPLVACVPATLAGKRVWPFDPYTSSQGNAWILEDANGDIYRYHHLSAFEEGLEVGDTVAPGDVIGYIGKTGNAGWPHLHFEVRRGSTGGPAEDPLPLIDVPEGVPVQPLNDGC